MKLRTKRATTTIDIDGATITARQVLPVETKKIIAKHTKYKGRGSARVEKVDDHAVSSDTFCKMITEWEGVTDEDGKDLECNDANKALVFAHDPQFVIDVMTEFTDIITAREDMEAKN